MKNKIRITVSAITILFFVITTHTLSAQTASDKIQTVEIKTSAVCGMCKKTIETAVYQVSGIKDAQLNVETKVVTVTYNSEKTSVEEIKKAITLAGYDADEMVADEKAYEELHGCCKKDAHH